MISPFRLGDILATLQGAGRLRHRFTPHKMFRDRERRLAEPLNAMGTEWKRGKEGRGASGQARRDRHQPMALSETAIPFGQMPADGYQPRSSATDAVKAFCAHGVWGPRESLCRER
jgi:hypothetical protein